MSGSPSVLSMSSDVPVPVADMPSLGMAMGGPLAGLSITAMLYGISIPQLVIYYRRYPNDPRLFRYSIVLLWILDTLQLALISSALYFYLVTSHGNYQALLKFTWTLRSQNTVSRVIVVGIQAIYAIRIWKLGRHFYTVLLWCSYLSVAATLAVAIYAIYASYIVQDFPSLSSVSVPISTVFATTAVTDIVIAGVMCFCLHKGREITRVSSTIKIIVTLM
ncbi:hypothetical protein EV421DRAFT_129936 [Armillaria borealis]|uniref:Uncharacterized protein n=1 Tax=Armillaria borealis TaxID=47425 RepID=A0AA39MFK2_9AGAR|nr:hypothetical protein EV421DRAFT_129936 [Armillaria borealis]